MKKKKEARKTTTLRGDLHKRLKISCVNWNHTLEELIDEAVARFLQQSRLDK